MYINDYEVYAGGSKISKIVLNNEVLYELNEKEFAIEYTIEPRNTSDKVKSYAIDSTGSNCYYYLPRIYTDESTWSITGYDKIEITKKDGTITDNFSTLANEVEKIKLWYPKNTPKISFHGHMTYPCCLKEILNILNINTSNLTNMSNMFYNCNKLTSLDLSNWDTSKVTNMNYMFRGCSSLTSLDLSNWDTSKVTNMNYMFSSVPSTVDWHYNETNYANWTLTESQTKYSGIFPWNQAYIEYTIEPIDGWRVSKTSYSSSDYYFLPRIHTAMFSHLNPDTSNVLITKTDGTTTDDVTTLASDVEKIKVFYNKNKLYKFSFYGYEHYPCYVKEILNVKNCIKTDMSYMFYRCSSLTSLDLSNWDTSNVTNMSNMFYSCSKLTSLDLSNFNTSKVTNMSNMFYYCSKLTSLDVSSFDTSSVTTMGSMFSGCSSCTIYVGSNFTLTESQTSFSGKFTRL